MLTPDESITASVVSRMYADAMAGEIEFDAPITRIVYVLIVLDFATRKAVPRKIVAIVDQTASTIFLADHGPMGPATPVDADCFTRTEAAFLDLEDHLMALGVSVQIG